MRKPAHIQISIPTPCQEDWNKMTPAEQGMFCDSCKKCVVDFTTWTDSQVYRYITSHQSDSICGRFLNSQLNRDIQIPVQPHSRLYYYFVALGITLLFTYSPDAKVLAKAPYAYTNPFEFDTNDSTKNCTDNAKIPLGGQQLSTATSTYDTTKYIIDGMQVYGSRGINLSQGAVEMIDIEQSGTPASKNGFESTSPYKTLSPIQREGTNKKRKIR